MPEFSVWIKVFGTEEEMAWHSSAYATEDAAADAAITYFKSGGNESPLEGLVESDPRGTEDNGDYVCKVATATRAG
jgi:hypothetical protein